MKIHKIQGDLTTEITSKIKDYCSIDCEMQGLKPDRDKLSIVSLTADDENVYIVQPNKDYKGTVPLTLKTFDGSSSVDTNITIIKLARYNW